jgi:glycosyltransferase involved in cell wall biosynthesis
MPVYNTEKYLNESIESILNQTFKDFELLIINDGSTDKSEEIIKSYTDERIRFINNEGNKGIPYTRNKGIQLSKGKYVAILDSDDYSYPDRLEKQIKFLEENPDFGLVGGGMKVINDKSENLGLFSIPDDPSEKIPVILLFYDCFAQSSVMLRKSALPEEHYRISFPVSQDYDLWVRMSYNTKLWNIPEILINYRVHPENVTHKKKDLKEKMLKNIYSYQLDKMNIDYSLEELDLHYKTYNNNFIPAKDFIEKVRKWFTKLNDFNEEKKFYPNIYLKEVIAQRWFDVCLHSSELGFWIFKTYKSFFLSKYYSIKFFQLIKFLVKCFIKWNKH